MSVATQVSVEEYLRAGYDPEREYVEGQMFERNIGEQSHSLVVMNLMMFLLPRAAEWRIFALQSWTYRLGPKHYRIPDLVILDGPEPDEQILSTAPMICVEVFSTEDRISAMLRKVSDYLDAGVRYVWVLDPRTKQATVYTSDGVSVIDQGELRTENPAIAIPLREIFE